jgi:uncharacterized protein YbaR (Trm112 family)
MSRPILAAYCVLLPAYCLVKGRIDMAISKELLDILVCPKCKGEIHLTDAGDGLICDHCRLLYEIKDDIPIMLIDEAKKLEEE